MTKKKKLVKEALKSPELYTPGELAYMRLWLNERKRLKLEKQKPEDQENVSTGLEAFTGAHTFSDENLKSNE